MRRFTEEAGNPSGRYRRYADRLLAICLVQGAAQHFVDTRIELKADRDIMLEQAEIDEKGYLVTHGGRVISGVKDIDVAFFFRADAALPIPPRKHCMKSTICEFASLGTRRVDFIKKGVGPDIADPDPLADVARVVRRYTMQTNHGRSYLSKKSIVGLHPDSIFASPLWTSRRLTSR